MKRFVFICKWLFWFVVLELVLTAYFLFIITFGIFMIPAIMARGLRSKDA